MEVTGSDVAVDITLANDGSLCALCLGDSGADYWILGDVFLRGWYSIHDLDNMKMGFVPHATSVKAVPT